MTDRFTMRIEVWEKDPETGTVFSEYGELYFRDEDNYYAFTEDEGFTLIPNPFKGRIDLRRFNHTCRKIYEIDEESGVFLLDNEVLSVYGYLIDSIDIIFHEDTIFPRHTDLYYDENGHVHEKTLYDFYELIDSVPLEE